MKTLLVTILILTSSFITLGQTKEIVATTDDGKKVILSSDGTWKYKIEVNSEKVTGELATFYFYRVREPGAFNNPLSISLDGKEIFEIAQDTYAAFQIKPGKYLFKMRNKDRGALPIEAEAGKTYYVLSSRVAGALLASYILSEVPKDQAVLQMKRMEVIKEGWQKKSDIVSFTKEKPE